MSTELLKRADVLPRHAEARRLRPGILTERDRGAGAGDA